MPFSPKPEPGSAPPPPMPIPTFGDRLPVSVEGVGRDGGFHEGGLAEYAREETQPQRRVERQYSTWDPRSSPATFALIAVNVAVFVWMVLHGVSAKYPSGEALLHYGANSSVLVLHGEWYRLLTATFVHIGLIHLASNMWCLWNLGLLGEPLIGPFGLVAVYLLTGIAGNLLSMAWDVGLALYLRSPLEINVGAGASGAVFGIAGILIILLSNRRLPIPWPELQRLRKSVVQFAGLNLVIGMATIFTHFLRIDNSAHLGGFLCGLALGFPLAPKMTAGRVRYLSRQKIAFVVAAFLLALFGYWVANLGGALTMEGTGGR